MRILLYLLCNSTIVFSLLFLSRIYSIHMNPHFTIPHVSREQVPALQKIINDKTKPIGALGELESLALRLGMIQNTLTQSLHKTHIVVFDGDHGIELEGISAYPQDVTWQMVMNFVRGGAGINVFARQHGIEVTIVDAGVAHEFPSTTPIIHAKIGLGTKNFVYESAMTSEQCHQAIRKGAEIVTAIHARGTNVIGFGEMGIGNTSSASAITSALLCIPVEECIGYGTGLDEGQYAKKLSLLYAATRFHTPISPIEILTTFGGFEIAMMCGAMLRAGELGMVVLVDGFIATSAFALASTMYTSLTDYGVFCHVSVEQGHKLLLNHLKVEPLLKLNMRLGEGTGCALAYPLLQSSLLFLEEMATFSSAGVAERV